jgi:hypothetical protein
MPEVNEFNRRNIEEFRGNHHQVVTAGRSASSIPPG